MTRIGLIILMLSICIGCSSIIDDYVALPGDGPTTDSMSEYDSSTEPDASIPPDASVDQ